MAIIDATDKILIDYIDTELDKMGIEYSKVWQNKYDGHILLDSEPCSDGFIVIYKFDNLKATRYKDKIANEFISKREYLEKCFNIKSYIRKD